MNIYIILILAIIISVICIMQKEKIQEGMSSSMNRGYLLKWGGKNYMNDCNDFTSSVGPYKNRNGSWLVGPCQTGFNDVTGGNANNNSCSKTYKGSGTVNNWKRSACNTGVHLGNFKKPLKAIQENDSIILVGEQFVTPVRGKLIDMKDDLGKNIKTTRDYTLEFEIKPRPNKYEPNGAISVRNIFQRSFVEPSKINWNVKNAVSPGIFFWPKKGSKDATKLFIDFGFGGSKNESERTIIGTPRLPVKKWTKVKITIKDKSCTVNLSGAINWNKSLKVRVPEISTIDQPYNKPNVKSYFYLSQPKTFSTNAKIKNMKWTNHPEKRCFARLPTGCDRALGELNHIQHSEYNKKDTGWIDGGWGWTGTEDDCYNNRKKAFNDYCKKSDAMVMMSEKEPSADVTGGWIGFNNSEQDSANIIKMSTFPQCKTECEDDPECNNIRWTTKDNTCTLMRAGPEKNTDGRWGFMKLWKKFSGGVKNKNNVTEHIVENNDLAWEQAQKKCNNLKQNLASKSEVLSYVQEIDNANSWVPVSDGINNWLQVGSKMSRASSREINPTKPDYGLLYQETEDVKRQTGDKMPAWGANTTRKDWKKKYYCSGTYKEPEKKIGKCPENCSKPTKITGNCQSGNPIETTVDGETKYYKKCSYKCLGLGESNYKDLQPKKGEKYQLDGDGNIDVDIHGCRTSTQCGECPDELVEIKGKFVEQNIGGVIKRSFVEDEKPKQDRSKFDEMNKKLNEMKSKYGANDNSSYNNEEKKSIESNEQNAADTTRSNMFLDITNANHIGQKDNSLEDYYKRKILNNNTENRLGGSKSAMEYLKKMPEDNNGKVTFFNSVWTLFN